MIRLVGCQHSSKATNLLIIGIVAIAILVTSPAHGDGMSLTTSTDTPPDQPLTLMTASQYLGDSNFYNQTWDPALMALATGSSDPAYRTIIDVRRFQPTQASAMPNSVIPFPTEEARANSAVALDAGPSACNGGIAIRTVDSFGAVHTIRITATQSTSTSSNPGPVGLRDISGASSRLSRLMEITEADEDWAKQLVHFGSEISRKHQLATSIGNGRLTFAAQLNSDRQATMGNEPLLNGTVTLTRGAGFTMAINPTPLFDNEVVNRLDMSWSRPGTPTRFSLRNLAWRRASSYLDATQVGGTAWVAGLDNTVNSRMSWSAAVSDWDGGGTRGLDTILTSQYRASSDRIFGVGLMDSAGSIGPFASFARTLPHGGRLYLSAGAPLDDRTRVPIACRMTMPL